MINGGALSNSNQEAQGEETGAVVNRKDFPDLNTINCKKNPNHTNFLIPTKLSEDKLPPGFRNRVFADILSLKAEETVRITVRYTSLQRPQELGHHDKKGTDFMRHGCGTVFPLFMGRPQKCHNTQCREGPRPHETSGTFKVVTVAHIVYDDLEAQNATVEFFFDDERNSEHIVKAQGVRISSRDVANNRSILECVTHNFGLFKRLQHFRSKKLTLQTQLPEALTRDLSHIEDLLVVLISHPHGAAKRISFGTLIKIERRGDHTAKVDGVTLKSCIFTYTAATCPGTGGGSVTVYNTHGCCIGFAPHFGVVDRRSTSALGWITEDYIDRTLPT